MNENVSQIIAFKADLRQQMRARRNALSRAERVLASQEIGEKLRGLLLEETQTIAVYLANASEINLDGFIQSLIDDKRLVVAPRLGVRPKFARLTHLENLRTNARGLRFPDSDEEVAAWEIDMMILPSVALDANGNRLGQGGGWYDKVLERARAKSAKSPLFIGVGYDFQVVESVPQTAHDQRVDLVVTEDRVLDCRRNDDN